MAIHTPFYSPTTRMLPYLPRYSSKTHFLFIIKGAILTAALEICVIASVFFNLSLSTLYCYHTGNL